MGLFNKQEKSMTASMRTTVQQSELGATEELEMLIEYFDQSTETILITHNLEELQKLVSNSFGTDASMNFSTANPPFSINSRWVKKVTIQQKF